MNLLATLLGLGLIVMSFAEALKFYHSTQCRQKLWLKGTEIITRGVLTKATDSESLFDLHCKTWLRRKGTRVTWDKGSLEIALEGSL